MKLNIQHLGTFYEMAREGAGIAADRLTEMTGVDTRISVTRLDFATPGEVAEEIASDDRDAGIRVTLSDGIDGTVVVVFDDTEAMGVAEQLVNEVPPRDDGQELVTSAVAEVCQVMNSGFIDGWADVLRTHIEMSTPEYRTADSPGGLLDIDSTELEEDGLAFVFRNEVEAVDSGVSFNLEHYFLPEVDSARSLFATDSGPGIEYDKLSGFDRMAERGAEKAADYLNQETGLGADLDIHRVNFVSLEAIPESVPRDEHVSVAFNFAGTPSGHLLFLYSETAASELARVTVDNPELDAIGRDAVSEVSNIMASGLLDGWANLLDTTIDHSHPAYTRDMGAAAVDPLIVGLADKQEFAFVFDTRITTDEPSIDQSEFDIKVYIIPDAPALERALQRVDTSQIDTTAIAADINISEVSDEKLTDVDQQIEESGLQ